MIRTSTDLTTWTLFEKIRLLELFMNKEILWFNILFKFIL